VILPVRDEVDRLADQLSALEAQTYRGPWEVVVADNGSRDDTARLAASWSDRLPLRVVDASRRPGINAARTQGCAAAQGDFLAFCDADDRVDPGWLEALVDAAASYDLVGGRIDEETLNEHDGPARRPRVPVDRLPIGLGFLPFAMGANLGIWAEVLRDLGGFDERFESGNDEVELAFRAQLHGRRLGFAPDAVVAYRHRREPGALFRQFRSYGRSEPLLYQRYRQHGLCRPGLPGVLRRWAWLVVAAPGANRSPERRGRWLVTAGFSVGRLQGSLRHRTLFL
jgi:glycosyltransferase involved in cell wall biosynthesis